MSASAEAVGAEGTADQEAGIAAGRTALYSLLARCFLEPPDARLVEALRDRVLPALASDPAQLGPGVAAEVANLRMMLGPPPAPSADADLLAADFTRFFRGLRQGDSPRPPYESLYVEDGALFAGPAFEVREEYALHGLAPAGAHAGEPPDHLGLEFSLLARLCEWESRAIADRDGRKAAESVEAQRRFIGAHVGQWLPRFRAEVERRDKAGFYSSLLRLAELWISSERDRLEVT